MWRFKVFGHLASQSYKYIQVTGITNRDLLLLNAINLRHFPLFGKYIKGGFKGFDQIRYYQLL